MRPVSTFFNIQLSNSRGLTYFLKLHIIIVQGGQRRVSAKALKHNSVPGCLVMQSFQ